MKAEKAEKPVVALEAVACIADRGGEIRVQFGTYDGVRALDVRKFWPNKAGLMRPTIKGVMVPAEQAEAFLAGVQAAVQALRKP